MVVTVRRPNARCIHARERGLAFTRDHKAGILCPPDSDERLAERPALLGGRVQPAGLGLG